MDPSTTGEEEEEKEQIDPLTLQPQLFAAATVNNTEQVLEYINLGVPVTHLDQRSGFTALHWAALNGNVVLVKKLLESGASEPYHTCRAKIQSQASKTNRRKLRAAGSAVTMDGGVDEEKTDSHGDANGSAESKDQDNNGSNNNNNEKNKHDSDEENEDDDHFDNHVSLEATHDYTRNTPLLWATQRGHLRVIWLLLIDGYSPNDLDSMENNAVHLAAALGDVRIMQVLLQDGGNANVVNHYKNHAIDMAKNKPIREMLSVSMIQDASLTDEDRAVKHDKNMKQYAKMMNVLVDAVNDAMSARELSSHSEMVSQDVNDSLSNAIALGRDNALDEDTITQAVDLLRKIELSQDLFADILALQSVMPITDQSTYIECVYKLESSIQLAIQRKVDQSHIQLGLDMIGRCQIEYWVHVMWSRLKDIVVATDAHEHDMNKLRAALAKAKAMQANPEVIEKAANFLGRFDAELEMYRALRAIPPIKMPMDNAPEGYYTELDVGKVAETEGYPLPPAATGEYEWIPAPSLTQFLNAIARLKSVYQSTEGLGANPVIVQESKDRLTKSEKEIKALEAKDAADKVIAIEAVKKLAKKLKAGAKKKK